MSPVQTSYAAEHEIGFEGQRANFGIFNSFSKVAEGSDINFGRAVVEGSGDDYAALPTAAGQRFLGVTQYTTAWAAGADDIHLYPENREMNIVDLGYMYVEVEVAVVPGDPAFFRHTAGVGENLGAFRNDEDGGDADRINGASFESTTDIGGIALLKLRGDIPAPKLYDIATVVDADIPIDSLTTLIDTTLGASASAMDDGVDGQHKTLKMTVDGGDMVITPTNLFDGTTLTFADVNDSIELEFLNGSWHVISNNGVVIA